MGSGDDHAVCKTSHNVTDAKCVLDAVNKPAVAVDN